MRRLFSTFANGFPGAALLLLRLVTAVALVDHGSVRFFDLVLPSIVGITAGILILLGLWTPVVGVIVAILALWSIHAEAGDPWIFILLGTIGASLALLGPGAWSIDARLFGWKRLESSVWKN